MSNARFSRNDQSLKWIRVGDLTVEWPDAQRALAEYNAKQIAKDFDPDIFGTLTVSPLPSGKFHVDDGWTRASAVRILFDENQTVPCIVVSAESAKRAAQIFGKMNGGRTKPSALSMFKVAVTAEEPSATAVNSIAAEFGLRITSNAGNGQVRAASALLWVHKQYGATGLRSTLSTICSMWGMDSVAFDASILRGVAMFLAGSNIDVDKLAKKVAKKYTPGKLIGSAKATREAFGGSIPSAVSELLSQTYTSRVTKVA